MTKRDPNDCNHDNVEWERFEVSRSNRDLSHVSQIGVCRDCGKNIYWGVDVRQVLDAAMLTERSSYAA